MPYSIVAWRVPDPTDTPFEAIPAATLIVMRGAPGETAELLVVERAATMAFAPGAIVFPGGRIDPGDNALAARLPDAPDDVEARIAAIRETIEEAGVAIGIAPPPPDAARRALLDGATIGDVLDLGRHRLNLDALVPFARWRPTHRPTRIFDTRFYLARAPEPVVANVDASENVRLFWATAADLLAEADAGRLSLIFPTRCTLERLARLPDFAAAAADARVRPVTLIAPTIERRDGVDHLCIPEGLGYPIVSRPMTPGMRG